MKRIAMFLAAAALALTPGAAAAKKPEKGPDREVAPVKPAKDLDADEPDAGLGDEPDLD